MSKDIRRRLAFQDVDHEWKVIGQDEIIAIKEPVVILGDPGLGKSILTQTLGEGPGMQYYRAGRFVRAANPENLIAANERIIIDGLDEIASTALGGGVEAVLKQLSAMGNPPFILSCREADWRGGADRIKIEDDYLAAPVLLHLQPFEYDDARVFLSSEFPAIDADFVLKHLSSRGLEDIYKNPLTLRLLGEVAQEPGELPKSRAELLDRACHVMLKEENPRHLDSSHVRRSGEELLLAAGAICGTQLLCDRIGVYAGPYMNRPDGFLHHADVARLAYGEAADDVLKTRLFYAEGEQRFTHVHRVVAEYLGARWLARCFESGLSERRIFSLFRQGEGVPTSLRGLHAWMGHFSKALAGRCIAADPYAVLRYGDAETLELELARALLAALANLSEEDPYFRSEDWGRHPVSGLMRVELKDEILSIIGTPHQHTQLTTLLIDAMAGTQVAKEISPALDAIIFDCQRFFAERAGAAEAMLATGVVDDWEAVMKRLLAMGDADSARLAVQILRDVGADSISVRTSVEAVLAYVGMTVSEIPRARAKPTILPRLRDDLFNGLGIEQRMRALDEITATAQPLMKGADHSTKAEIADLVRSLAVEVLEEDAIVAPARVWAWIGWLQGHEGYRDRTKMQLAEVFQREHVLRAGVLEYVLLTPCETSTWMAAHRLGDAQIGLYPTIEDLVEMLRALRLRAVGGVIDADAWRDLVRIGRSREGIAEILYNAAYETANGDEELLDFLTEMAEPKVPEWEIEQADREARAEAERQSIYQSHRRHHAERAQEIAAGNFHDLTVAADVYLALCSDFDRSIAPEDRLREFLGNDLADQALKGFVAILSRDDLPSAAQVADIHCKGKQWVAEKPMVCGVEVMVRRGDSIDTLDREVLSATLMVWHRGLSSHLDDVPDIGSELEKILFTNEGEIEEYFKASIEPQLACGKNHPEELHRLLHESQWKDVAARLAIKWLRSNPALPFQVQHELMDFALEAAPLEMMQSVVIATRQTTHPNYAVMLLWLSADFAVDFSECRAALYKAAADDPSFIWIIRDRLGAEGSKSSRGLSVGQLQFIVEAFGSLWPKVDRPGGVTSGDTNPWDASAFIEHAIYGIANMPSPEATESLQSLIGGAAPSYVDQMRHALSLQRKARRDSEYVAPAIEQLHAVIADQLPGSIDDMRAYLGDRIEAVQERIRGSNTDMWEAYWDQSKPQGENYCRNRLIEHISGQLPPSIRFEPEMHMPGQKRADIAAIREAIGLPVEIKGQWHRYVWSAPIDQLDAKYTRDWHAQGRGAYIVMWFGDVPRKRLPRHPDGLDPPKTPEALRLMLIERIPEARRTQIDVFVVDVSRPAESD